MSLGGAFVNKATGVEILSLNECTYFGQGFTEDPSLAARISGEVAFAQFGTCPQNLGTVIGKDEFEVTLEEYADFFRGKIAVFSDAGRDQWCLKDFFAQFYAYDSMVLAGAAGIVFVDSTTGTIPGIWYGAYGSATTAGFRDPRLLDLPLVPFLHCSQSVISGGSSSQEEISSFLGSLSTYSQAVGTFPQGLNFTATATVNQWDNLFQQTIYFVNFQVITPILFFMVFLLAMYHTLERLHKSYNKKEKLVKAINVPVVALQLEAWSCFVIGYFFAVDGLWAEYSSSVAQWRALMISQLSMVSMATSVLVGLSFSDFRQNTKRLRSKKKSFIQRFRFPLLGSAVIFVAVEALGEIFRRIGELAIIVNTMSTMISILVSFWFFYEGRTFTKLLQGFTSNDRNGSHSTLGQILRHTNRWIYLATFALVFSVSLTVPATFIPWFLFSPERWLLYWTATNVLRAFYSFCKVKLLRSQYSKKSSTYNTTQMSPTAQLMSSSHSRMRTVDTNEPSSFQGSSFQGTTKGYTTGARSRRAPSGVSTTGSRIAPREEIDLVI